MPGFAMLKSTSTKQLVTMVFGYLLMLASLAGCAGGSASGRKGDDVSASNAAARSGAKRFVDDNEYKDANFRRCSIGDYSELVEVDDAGWAWIKPNYRLARYNLKVGAVENRSPIKSRSITDAVRSAFTDVFNGQHSKGAQGSLTANLCIYEAERFTPGKAWIPFAGGHQMQAGIGIEMILLENGRPVGKFRHFARQGAQIQEAAQEVAEDLTKFISKH